MQDFETESEIELKDEVISNKKKKDKQKVWLKHETIAYEKELRTLQIELLKLQNHIKKEGLKVLMIFEGRDAAGKGGTIKRLTEHLNPRGARVVALEKPSEIERTQWYFQRYVQHLPSAGEMVFFDRSWYNRAGVEPVMGFCTHKEHQKFLRETPLFEEMIASSGIKLFKFYFSVKKEEQAKRFKSRKTDPLKQYKLSAVDEKSQSLWDEYTMAKYSMLLSTHTPATPWTIIRSNNKKKARINCIKHVLANIDYPDKLDSTFFQVEEDIVINGEDEILNMEKNIQKTI